MMKMQDLKTFVRARSTAVEVVELAAIIGALFDRRKPGRRLSTQTKERMTCHLRGAARAFARGICDLRTSSLRRADYLLASEEALRRAEFQQQ